MELKTVSVICFLCVTFSGVQSASVYYRNGRDIEIPIVNEIIREEIVAELKREPEIAVIETEPIAVVVEKEVPAIDQLRVAQPVIEIQEPVAVISEKELANGIVEEEIALRNVDSPVPVEVEKKVDPVPVVPETAVVKEETRNEPVVRVEEVAIVPVVEIKSKDEVPVEEKVVALKSAPVEEPAVVQEEAVVAETVPVVESDEAIRQSEGAPVAPVTNRPTVIQAIQNQFQNFQHQIQSAFNPAAATAAPNSDSSASTVRPPGIIAQFQQAVGSVFNRPTGSATGPIQGFVNQVQTNLQSFPNIFRPNSGAAAAPAAAAAAPVVAPVETPAKTMLDEVPVVNEKIEVVDDKVGEVKEVVEKKDE